MKPEDLLEKVKRREFTLGVMGLGRVGLPLALAFASRGIRTIGLDVDENRVGDIRGGTMPFRELGADEVLQGLNGNDVFRVTNKYADLREADAIFVTVGTVLNSESRPDYSQLNAALTGLAEALRPVQIIMLRSTVAPGTLLKVVKPFMERTLNIKVGRDVLLASTPERIASGIALKELPMLPEIAGGADEFSSQVAAEVLKCLNADKLVSITTSTSAELAKLFTNVYRYVTFALANEFALLAEVHGQDAHEIIRMANANYPRGGIPLPGPCGGPCLTKDGYFLVEDLIFPDFILTAWKLNEGVPAHMVRRLKQCLGQRGIALADAKIIVLGLGFKAESDDTRMSPAVRTIELLKTEGAAVTVCDPYFETPDIATVIGEADAVVLATNHAAYLGLDLDAVARLNPPPILVDYWGAWDEDRARAAGIPLITFGKGDGV
ncbi:MAG TPA: nucleotide sugar dehydrogenase [Dehalococcoidia bacterium]|nr:nucleotide sugar dehydrogenase [Dehalococcoidia bacterium]